MTDWTPAMQAWLDETMSRSKPPTIRQLDIVRNAFRNAAASQPSEDLTAA